MASCVEGNLLTERRILLVEDHHPNQQIMISVLERAGYRVDLVDNGSSAVSAFEKRRYDLVLMDVILPLMNGCSTSQKIRGLEAAQLDRGLTPARKVPIIALSALPLDHFKEEYIQAEMNDYLSKPFRLEILLEKVQRWLSP
jgi:CheY-like chemotaxis protein